MPLSNAIAREPMHTRQISVQAFRRADGLWDLDAHITDVKTFDFKLEAGTRPAGQPVHDMWVRITIDVNMNIVAAEACSDWVPYPGHCDTIGPQYEKLVGLNLMRQFRQNVRERLGGTQGCTHMTELAQILPTVAVQAFAGVVENTRTRPDTNEKPLQLDRCHALATTAEAVRLYYPRWYAPVQAQRADTLVTHSQEGSA